MELANITFSSLLSTFHYWNLAAFKFRITVNDNEHKSNSQLEDHGIYFVSGKNKSTVAVIFLSISNAFYDH